MNRLVEEMKLEIEYYLIVRGKYLKFVEFSFKVFIFGEEFEVIQFVYEEFMCDWEVGQEKFLSEFFEELDFLKLFLIMVLIEEGVVEECDGVLVLRGKLLLDNLEFEFRFLIDGFEEEFDEFDDLNVIFIMEYILSKYYYVEVFEVDREFFENVFEIVEEYVIEESLVEVIFDVIVCFVLVEKIFELVEKYRRKNEFIEVFMEIEFIMVEVEGDRVNIYYDEDVIEDFFKILQMFGYLKVKGNRIWV